MNYLNKNTVKLFFTRCVSVFFTFLNIKHENQQTSTLSTRANEHSSIIFSLTIKKKTDHKQSNNPLHPLKLVFYQLMIVLLILHY